jgi:hypothetical protein
MTQDKKKERHRLLPGLQLVGRQRREPALGVRRCAHDGFTSGVWHFRLCTPEHVEEMMQVQPQLLGVEAEGRTGRAESAVARIAAQTQVMVV